jgi:hypothetical protein
VTEFPEEVLEPGVLPRPFSDVMGDALMVAMDNETYGLTMELVYKGSVFTCQFKVLKVLIPQADAIVGTKQ